MRRMPPVRIGIGLMESSPSIDVDVAVRATGLDPTRGRGLNGAITIALQDQVSTSNTLSPST